MDLHQIAGLLTKVPPNRNPLNLTCPARVRLLRPTHVSGWVRPNVHIDGNPLRLSCIMEQLWAEQYLSGPLPKLYELVPCDKVGMPLDAKLRSEYLAWLKSQYSYDFGTHFDAPQVAPVASNIIDAQPEAHSTAPEETQPVAVDDKTATTDQAVSAPTTAVVDQASAVDASASPAKASRTSRRTDR